MSVLMCNKYGVMHLLYGLHVNTVAIVRLTQMPCGFGTGFSDILSTKVALAPLVGPTGGFRECWS